MTLIIVVVAIAVLVLILIAGYSRLYNRLVGLRNAMQAAWADIDVLLKRRFDLVPNLVEVAKKYMAHESEVLVGVTRARAGLEEARASGDVGTQLKAENTMGGALGRLMISVEAYPDLKADTHMTELMSQLTDAENQIARARSGYNHAVKANNDGVQMFPANVVAGIHTFKPGVFFEITEAVEREAPKVRF